jgi:hypothetical protein
MNDPQTPLQRLLTELDRIFAAVPQTPEDERAGFIMALVETARFVGVAGLRHPRDRLTNLADALSDLDNGRVVPMLQPWTGRGRSPDSRAMWGDRVLVLAVQLVLHKSGMSLAAAAEYIGTQRPDLKSLMTRGKNLPDAIQRWRRELDEAKPGTVLAEFSERKIHAENTVLQHPPADGWRHGADRLLAQIRANPPG